ncbi:uncharacterized protein BP5553_05382 [Venustampulla echinocandica]|uniref:C2H2-type domain-containing protein n=1 Tax=Venustampulla echinocandica TaxID=2656787 RepID=A0A370TR03_9HELO|nr:uncharacterized protein BP5553_05382 [Venustampulla echinocandica]RDL37949.1 hypothetical protein BP5553_05382 [Venustampulla echinocandica]
MSSLKDIMDVDVEPLQSQAYRRSREAAQQQASSHSSIAIPSETPSPAPDDDDLHTHDSHTDLSKGKAPIKRRKSNRISNPSSLSIASGSDVPRGRDSPIGDAMDFSSGYPTAGSSQASSTGGTQQIQRVPEVGTDIPVKYTPVTGRISRAKKGVPVHTCDICSPAKTFTRAEHLRRHQLSHQKPAYACTVENCGSTFYRPDLLARHMLRHESGSVQGGNSSDRRSSRASSNASERQAPILKVETPGHVFGGHQGSMTGAATPRTSGSVESSMTISSSGTITNLAGFSPQSSASHKRSASEAQLHEPDPYPTTSPQPSGPSVSLGQLTPDYTTDLPQRDIFSGPSPAGFDGEMYTEPGEARFSTTFTPTQHLTVLSIPDESFPTHVSYPQDNSPWCSSASDSTFSSYSESSRNGRHRRSRGRSTSVADWPISSASPWSPQGISATPQDLRSSPFDIFLEQSGGAYASPRMSSPTIQVQHLDVPSTYGNSIYMESVGTPALSPYSKPMSQVFSASPSRVSESRLAGIPASRQKEQLAAMNNGISTISDCQPPPQLDIYINSYWDNFHPFFPIIHRQTSEPIKDNLLTSALAAIGTQYHDTTEARVIGSELNESCRKGIGHCPTWTLQTMQAILLTEVFSRFRGRKTTVRLSRQFDELYGRLLKGIDQSYKAIESPDIPTQWFQWAEIEGHKRLLSACFIFDVQQALYHQQPRSKALGGETRPFLPTLCSDSLWNAGTAIEWQAHLTDYPLDQPLQLLEQSICSQRTSPRSSAFTQSLLICFLATRLPMRENPRCPNAYLPHAPDSGLTSLMDPFPTSSLAQTYLALHHTPLHDLLAIAGDTWIFGQKVTPPSAFHDAQSRLKTWSSSVAAAQATHHACRILSVGLCQPSTHENNYNEVGLGYLSKYWGLYIAALICWAFGHRYQPSGSSSGSLTRSNSYTAIGDTDANGHYQSSSSAIDAQVKTANYVNSMLELSVEDLLTNRASMRGETSAVIDAVRHGLGSDGLGDKCSMLVDCIGVLKKLSKTGKGKWF